MNKPRKPRSDSTTAAVLAYQRKTPPVPEHITLRPCDLPYWRAGLSARDDWAEHELCLLAQMARAMADHERLANEADAEGAVIDGKINPKFTVADMALKMAMALARSLQINARATRGEARDTARRKPIPKFDDLDDLIPRPH